MIRLYDKLVSLLSSLRDLPLLFFRLIIAYGFMGPAEVKLGFKAYSISDWNEHGKDIPAHIETISNWFATLRFHFPGTDFTLPMPNPYLNAVMATATENIGYICIALGFATRLITIPMMFVMLVAISTVHLVVGFAACSSDYDPGKFGYEIPFYYFFMLFALMVLGPGRISIDGLIARLARRPQA